jgi:hypothetical protein
VLQPGLLHGVQGVFRRGQAFDGRYAAAIDGRDRYDARTSRRTINVDGARAALTDAAAELGPPELQVVADDPEERCARVSFK